MTEQEQIEEAQTSVQQEEQAEVEASEILSNVETEAGQEEQEEKQEEPQKKSGENRYRKLANDNRELHKRIEELKNQLESFRPKEQESKKPSREEFANDSEYTEALTDWKVDQALKARQKVETERTQQAQESNKAVQNWIEKVESKKAEYPDFNEVASSADFVLPPDVAKYIAGSPVGVDVAYNLVKNSSLHDAMVNAQSPLEIARIVKATENYYLSKQFNLGVVPEQKKTITQTAPAMPKIGSGVKEVPMSKLSPEEYRKRRREQRRK